MEDVRKVEGVTVEMSRNGIQRKRSLVLRSKIPRGWLQVSLRTGGRGCGRQVSWEGGGQGLDCQHMLLRKALGC